MWLLFKERDIVMIIIASSKQGNMIAWKYWYKTNHSNFWFWTWTDVFYNWVFEFWVFDHEDKQNEV